MKTFLTLLASVSFGAAFASADNPQCTVTQVAADADTGAVTVTYSLDADAIVTAAFEVDGAALPAERCTALAGEVNRYVKAGTGLTLTWRPDRDLGDTALADAKPVLTAWAPDVPPPYMVVNLAATKDVRYYASKEAIPGGVGDRLYKTQRMVFAKIPASGRNWVCGSAYGEYSTERRESLNTVTFSEDYYMAIYECTCAQYLTITNSNPTKTATSHPYTADLDVTPVASCTMANIRGGRDFASAPTANSLIGKWRTRTGLALDLPTRAQWEVAARAGISGRINVVGATMDEIAWTNGNWKKDPKYTAGLYTANQTHEVGLLLPNAFGLYDTVGNVLELGRDWLGDDTLAGIIARLGEGATAANVRDVVWIDPIGLTYPSGNTNCGRFGGGYGEGSGNNGMSPARWAGSGYNGQTDTGFRLMCPVRFGGRLTSETYVEKRLMTVTYDLAEDSIVTFDVKHNGVSLGAAASDVGGEANKLVLAGTARKIYWRPDRVAPGVDPAELTPEVKVWKKDAPPDYMVVELHSGDVRYYADEMFIPDGGVTNRKYKSTHYVMRKIPAKDVIWTMGSTAANASTKVREIMHRVKLSSDYYMGIYEFTQGQYAASTNATSPFTTWDLIDPSLYKYFPLDKCTFVAMRGKMKCESADPTATSVMGVMRTRCRLAYDIPNCAQWEFAARGGLPGNIPVAGKTINEIAWSSANWTQDPATAERAAAGKTVSPHEVGLLPCNAFGLYDMQGNYFEYTTDFLPSDTEDNWRATFGKQIGTDTDGQPIYGDPPVQEGTSDTTIAMVSQKYSDGTNANNMSLGRHAAGRKATTSENGLGWRLIVPAANGGFIQ